MSVEIGPNQYRCALCKGIFDKGQSEEAAILEKERDFPNMPTQACSTVCDDCYQKVRPDTHPQAYQAYKSQQN